MACREKKTVNSKKSASPAPTNKEVLALTTAEALASTAKADSMAASEDSAPPKLTVIKPMVTPSKTRNSPAASNKNAKILTKKIVKGGGVGAKPKALSLNLKAKAVKKSIKIKKLAKAGLLGNVPKTAQDKKALLNNGAIKPVTKRIRKTKAQIKAEREQALKENDVPPVLEPMLPIVAQETNVKKTPSKKKVKKAVPPSLPSPLPIPISQIKSEDNPKKSEERMLLIDQTIKSVINSYAKDPPAKSSKRKSKGSNLPEAKRIIGESFEDLVKDLTDLIQEETVTIKQEIPDDDKTEVLKPNNKKLTMSTTRKAKSGLLNTKSKAIKKEIIENNLGNNIILDAAAQHLIDALDLSVHKIARNCSSPVPNRRHSIEKFPIAAAFSNLPRTISPKTKRFSRARKSLDTLYNKRASPYSTRSDNQALRNGKSRRRNELIFEGLESTRRRNRSLNSDFSGSERSISRSGYESDCSASDKLSSCGRDSVDLQKDGQLKNEVVVDTAQNQTDAQNNLVNSSSGNKNSSSENAEDNTKECVEVKPEDSANNVVTKNSSLKVPEKSIILDIMKQAFNDAIEDREKRTTRSSLKKNAKTEEESNSVANNDSEFSTISTLKFYGASDSKAAAVAAEGSSSSSSDVAVVNGGANLNVVQSNTEDSHLQVNGDINISNGPVAECSTSTPTPTPDADDKKKDIIRALGLLTLPEAEEVRKNQVLALEEARTRASEQTDESKKAAKSDYTGTLKTVIRKKAGRNSLKWILGKNKTKTTSKTKDSDGQGEQKLKNSKEVQSTSWRSHSMPSSDTAGALRKSHYSNRSNNLDGSSEEGETEDADNKIIIPEKASSYAVHPDKLCADECEHCKTKFGVFDTPQHIALLKNVERQNKILLNEPKLTPESCLCDACYRHVDRKANAPAYLNKGFKKVNVITPRQNYCHVLGCNNPSSNILRRKLMIKMRKSICQVVNIDLDNPGLHSIPICSDHYSILQHLMICFVCKRKLARNAVYYIGPDFTDLNEALSAEGVPVQLTEKVWVCKCCKMFSTIIMKPLEDRSKGDICFYNQQKKRLMHFHGIELMEEDEMEEPIAVPPAKDKSETEQPPPVKKKKKLPKTIENSRSSEMVDAIKKNTSVNSESNSTGKSRSESPSDSMIDYNMLTPTIAIECSDNDQMITNIKKDSTIASQNANQRSKRISVRKIELVRTPARSMSGGTFDNLMDNNNAVQRLGSNPSISVRQLFPGEEEMGLQGQIDFGHVKEKTPEGWEKCTTIIQYDTETKNMWNELQKPYGSQSSFLRHLVLLEKYYRNGDLILSQNATNNSINYSESVQNRLRAFDNIPTLPSQVSLIRKNTAPVTTAVKISPVTKTAPINAATIPKNTPITIAQINTIATSSLSTKPVILTPSPPSASSTPTPVLEKDKKSGVPPGLISLQNQKPRFQKFKFPLVNNWKPNLIPIDPKDEKDKYTGFMKVLSNGKPYLLNVEDYNRMSALKKSFEMKKKRMEATQSSSVLKRLQGVRKGVTISKKPTTVTNETKNINKAVTVTERNVEKLGRTPLTITETLESRLMASTASTPVSLINLPKIPKSLTVIPQTVSRASQLQSPGVMATLKIKQPANSNNNNNNGNDKS